MVLSLNGFSLVPSYIFIKYSKLEFYTVSIAMYMFVRKKRRG